VTVAPQQLSRLVSHALRHEPGLYELELDDEGWVPIDALLAAIHEHGQEWTDVDRTQLVTMIDTSAKRRHEIDGDRIRALYGHSTPNRITRVATDPPTQLFHCTSTQAWADIQRGGLQPMGRQYVHLSTNLARAAQVGRRKSSAPVILIVEALRSHQAGATFWRGNDTVWLADHVDPEFLSPTTPQD
jgi:putative RNA 2'-phosphotransferase